MRHNDWSVSEFSDKIRGNVKPKFASASGWDQWESDQKRDNPIRYWLAEEGLTILQNIVYFPYDIFRSIRRYLKNRFIDKTHALSSSNKHLKKGTWYDLSDRILFCMFDSLVDFVEIECAYHNHHFMSDEQKKVYNIPYYASFFNIRNPQLGIDYLKWASSLEDEPVYNPSHAECSRTILELYYWWKKRDSRLDIYESDYQNARDAFDLENQYKNEDDEMLIKLIKVRNQLWT